MKLRNTFAVFILFFAAGFASAQDLGPQTRKLEEGVYVYVGKNFNSNCGIVRQINNLPPLVPTPDILGAAKMMKSLTPLHVVPGDGTPGTVKTFEDSEKYYALLLERVSRLAKEGKPLDQIKKEVGMPEYENWAAQERFPTNVEAAYRAVKGG